MKVFDITLIFWINSNWLDETVFWILMIMYILLAWINITLHADVSFPQSKCYCKNQERSKVSLTHQHVFKQMSYSDGDNKLELRSSMQQKSSSNLIFRSVVSKWSNCKFEVRYLPRKKTRRKSKIPAIRILAMLGDKLVIKGLFTSITLP